MQPGTRGRKYTASISRHNTQHFSVKMSENILFIFCIFSYLWDLVAIASGRESEWGGKSATATKRTANETLKHYPADETRGGKTSGGCWWRQQLPWSHATFVLTESPGAAQITRCALSRDQNATFLWSPEKRKTGISHCVLDDLSCEALRLHKNYVSPGAESRSWQIVLAI